MNILDVMKSTPMTVKELVAASGSSATAIRTALKKEVAEGNIIKHDGKPATFSLVQKQKPADQPKAKRRVNLNPQAAITKMQAQAKEYALDLIYNKKSRLWTLDELQMTSRELSELRAGGFEAFLADNYLEIN